MSESFSWNFGMEFYESRIGKWHDDAVYGMSGVHGTEDEKVLKLTTDIFE